MYTWSSDDIRMFCLNLFIFLCLAVDVSNGQTDPTLVCISKDNSEYAPPCVVTEGEVLYVKVIFTQDGSSYGLHSIFSENATSTTNRAIAGKDYIPFSENLRFVKASSPTDYMIPITTLDDTHEEPNEEFFVDAKFIQENTGSTAPCSACDFVVRIIDNDGVQLPTVAFDRTIYDVKEGEELIIGITRDTAGDATPSVVGLSATNINTTATDYRFDLNPTTVSVQPGSVGPLVIPTVPDNIEERPYEVFQLSINENPFYKRGSPSTALVYIIDPVVQPTFNIEFHAYNAREDQTPFKFSITRSSTGTEATIVFWTKDGSATAGDDYQAVSKGIATFSKFSDTAEGSITLLSDRSTEEPEVFEICISDPSVGNVGEISRATVTLYDAFAGQCQPPCMNGVCVGPDHCECQPGYQGETCSESQCRDVNVPCQNLGTCIGPDTCMCYSGITGPTCGPVECPPSYCINGATCESTDTSYSCRCVEGYGGDRCDVVIPSVYSADSGLATWVIGLLAAVPVTGAIVTIAVAAVCCYLLRRSRLNPKSDQIPLQMYMQSREPVGLSRGIFTDGNMITYPFNIPTVTESDVAWQIDPFLPR